ncbi:MAG: transcription antitermination factor NusB [Acetatifactor sp.]|nr:transcription antitermination factor NusB [Acetatifactor sp.]
MGRHELREQVFRLLFRSEFHTLEEMPQQVRLFIEGSEEITREKDAEAVSEKYNCVQEKIPQLDKMLNEQMDGWDTGRIGKVELTILRIALYEMLFDESVPNGVAIDEAVEIAKTYGQENSGAFVNAVLAKFVKTGD